MPRVFTAKAAKDYPDHGIVKGQLYYHWSTFRGPKQMSATQPRPSQVTGNDKLSALYAAGEQFEDELQKFKTPEDAAQGLRDYAEAVGEVIEMYQESISNLEGAFQGGNPTIDEFNDNVDNLEGFKDDLEAAADEIDALEAVDYVDEDEVRSRAVDDTEAAWKGDGDFVEEDHEDDIEGRAEAMKAEVTDFENLNSADQGSMLDAAIEIAQGPSCPL